jgi:spore maturation protein SpmB
MGSQVQYMGRLLGTAGVQSRYYPVMFGICILNACIAMLIMRFFA